MFTIPIFISIPCTISCSSNVVFSGFCFSKTANLFYSSIMRSIISAEKYLAKYSTGSSRLSSNVCSSSKNSIVFVCGVFFSQLYFLAVFFFDSNFFFASLSFVILFDPACLSSSLSVVSCSSYSSSVTSSSKSDSSESISGSLTGFLSLLRP